MGRIGNKIVRSSQSVRQSWAEGSWLGRSGMVASAIGSAAFAVCCWNINSSTAEADNWYEAADCSVAAANKQREQGQTEAENNYHRLGNWQLNEAYKEKSNAFNWEVGAIGSAAVISAGIALRSKA